MTQLTLDLSQRTTRKRVGPELARRMIAILSVNKGWMKRQDFAAYGLDPRKCRLGRECSNARIIASQNGYKLLKYATPDEIRIASNAILSQIQAEQEQYRKLILRAHKVLAEKVA